MRSLKHTVRSVLPLFALSAALVAPAALAAPSTPVINSPGNGSRFVDAQTVNVAFTFWRQRTRSITWRVYDNGAERCSGSVGWDLTTNAVNRGCPVYLEPGGHTLTVSVCSDGCSSASVSVNVVRSPVMPSLTGLDANIPEGSTVNAQLSFQAYAGEPLSWTLNEGATALCSGTINATVNGTQTRTCGKVFPPGPHTLTLTACHPQHSLCKSTTGSFTVTRLGWTRYLGAAGAFTQLEDLVTDPAGRSYSAGFTTGSLDGAPKTGVYDMFLSARDASGALIWSNQLGAPGSTITLGYGVARNSTFEEIYVAGYTTGALDGNVAVGSEDAFITKYRYTGVRQWTRQLGAAGRNTEAFGVAVDVADNVFLAGYTNGVLAGTVLAGSYDGFVAKYDPAGNRLWTRQFGGAGGTTLARRAATDGAGNVYVTGWTEATVLDGIARTGSQDVFVMKFDPAGNKLWTRLLGGPGAGASAYGVTTDDVGNVYAVGYAGGPFEGNPDHPSAIAAFVSKLDPAGNKVWTRMFGSSTRTWAWDVLVDARGVFVTGGGYGDVTNPASNSAASHAYIARLDANGNVVRVLQPESARFNGVAAHISANAFGTDANGNFYIAGNTEGDYDGNTRRGDEDGFVSRHPSP